MSGSLAEVKGPLVVGPPGKLTPPDIQDRFVKSTLNVRRYQDFNALDEMGVPLSVDKMLKQILWHTQIEILLKTLGTAFRPRVISIGTTPTQILRPNKVPRGYVILNPAEITTNSATVTYFASALRAPAAFTSTEISVTGAERMFAWLDMTVVEAGATLVVNLQSQDPLTSNWATSLGNIFSGVALVGTFDVALGPIGIAFRSRMIATVGVDDITFSIGGLSKGGGLGTTGTTIFLGGADTNTVIGFPMLPGQIERLYLMDNVALFGIVASGSLNLKVFELQ